MKISTSYNETNTNFKSFTVSYKADLALSRLPNSILGNIIEVGRKFEKTQYIDLELLSNLKFRIKEKGNIFSGITEPINIEKPKNNDNRIKISGIYDGVNDAHRKCGEVCHKYIRYTSNEEALKGYERIQSGETSIDRIGIIAKEMEKEKVFDYENERQSLDKKRKPLHQVLIDKYGDFVKEYK